LFGSCIIHILYIGCAEIKKNDSGAKGLNNPVFQYHLQASLPHYDRSVRVFTNSKYPTFQCDLKVTIFARDFKLVQVSICLSIQPHFTKYRHLISWGTTGFWRTLHHTAT